MRTIVLTAMAALCVQAAAAEPLTAVGDFHTSYGRMVDRTDLWAPVGGELITNFRNMYNLHIVAAPDSAHEDGYAYRGWFFGWILDDCNTGVQGCDAICAARAHAPEGPWEIYTGDGAWDATMSPETWHVALHADDTFYDSWHVGDPSAVWHEGRYYMAYSATGRNKDGIHYGHAGDTDSDISVVMGATSLDGLAWTRTEAPILIHQPNVGQAPIRPGEYMHPEGLYHRPSLMREDGIWKCWFDGFNAFGFSTLYAENRGDFGNPGDWMVVRGLDAPCIPNYPNPDVVKIEDLYFAFGDPGGYGEGWAGRQICEMVSANGLDWLAVGWIRPDEGYQANHVPEALVVPEDEEGYSLYVNYGAQTVGDFRYATIRMKRRTVTPAELAFWRVELAKAEEAAGRWEWPPR